MPGERINRVDQYDALMIDQEVKSMVFSQLLKVFDYFPQQVKLKYEDELKLILDFLFYKLTIGSNNRTPGNFIQNLDFGLDHTHGLTVKQKIGYVLLSILVPYLYRKFKIGRKYKWIQKLMTILNFVNFIWFLKTFQYRCLVERLLQIKLFKVEKGLERNIDFTYINRVIVWNALGKSLTSFLPFLDFTKITSFFAKTASITSYAHVDTSDLEHI